MNVAQKSRPLTPCRRILHGQTQDAGRHIAPNFNSTAANHTCQPYLLLLQLTDVPKHTISVRHSYPDASFGEA